MRHGTCDVTISKIVYMTVEETKNKLENKSESQIALRTMEKKGSKDNRTEREGALTSHEVTKEGLSEWVPSGQSLKEASNEEVHASKTASAKVLRKAQI